MNSAADFLPRVLETLAHSAGGRSNERRRAPRFGLHGSAEMTPLDRGYFPRAYSVRVRDVSSDGIGVITTEKFSPGAQFVLQFNADSRSQRPLRVMCLAQHVQRVGESAHRIGAKVIGPAGESLAAAA